MFAREPDLPQQPFACINGLVLDIVGNTLFGTREGAVRLEPRTTQLLAVLAANVGQVVRRGDLLDSVWGVEPVGDEVLSRHVSLIRKVFRDHAPDHEVIQTIRKAGYRFDAAITWLEAYRCDEPTDHDPTSSAKLPAGLTSPDAPRPAHPRWRIRRLLVQGAAPVLAVALVSLLGRTHSPAPAASLGPEPPPVAGTGRRITVDPLLEAYPDVSPLGGLIAFARIAPGGATSQIVLRSPGDAHERILAAGSRLYTHPRFSPDGAHVGYVAAAAGDCRIESVSLAGGPAKPLYRCPRGTPTAFDWSRDGGAIFLTADADRSRPAPIVSIALDTSQAHSVTSPEQGLHDRYPRLSADGRQLYFVRGDLAKASLWSVDLASGREQQMTRGDLSGVNGIAPLPGGGLAFGGQLDGVDQIMAIVHPGTPPEPIRGAQGLFPAVRSGPIGPVLAYGTLQHNVALLLAAPGDLRASVDAAVLDTDALLPSEALDEDPVFLGGRHRIAFCSNRSGAYEIWQLDLDDGALRQLTNFRAARLEFLDASPVNPGHLLVTEYLPGTDRFRARFVDVTNELHTTSTTIAGPFDDAMAAVFGPDGSTVYLGGRDRSGRWRVYRADLQRPQEFEAVSPAGPNFAYPLSDGRVLMAKAGEPGLWLKSVGSATAKLIDPAWGPFDALAVGTDLYFVSIPLRSGRALRICRTDSSVGYSADAVVCSAALSGGIAQITGFDVATDPGRGPLIAISALGDLRGDVWTHDLERCATDCD